MTDETKLDEILKTLLSVDAKLALLKDMMETKEKIKKMMKK